MLVCGEQDMSWLFDLYMRTVYLVCDMLSSFFVPVLAIAICITMSHHPIHASEHCPPGRGPIK